MDLEFKKKGDPAKDPQPQSVVAQATVMDVNRQAWSSTTTLLVHPADLYVGLRSERYFVWRGTPLLKQQARLGIFPLVTRSTGLVIEQLPDCPAIAHFAKVGQALFVHLGRACQIALEAGDDPKVVGQGGDAGREDAALIRWLTGQTAPEDDQIT